MEVSEMDSADHTEGQATGKLDALKGARPVCAVRRAVVNLLQTGRTRRTVLGSPNLPESERCRGQQHVRKAVVIRDANG